MIGGVLFPITMFWFAWSANFNSVHWVVPTLAGVFLSSSILLIFVAYLNYLTDTYLMYAASALAANTVVRSACGAAAPLFTSYMFESLGVGGTASSSTTLANGYEFAPSLRRHRKRNQMMRRKGTLAWQPGEGEAKTTRARKRQPDLTRKLVCQIRELEREIEKEKSTESLNGASGSDERYLDADGLEKAERWT
ncbi:hypothetical protein LTR53_005206 [Teratosphaeriaceae sp. CCFEE 6253]|nr:hypothetical protein LTR53_005206 [Teratosphaeriaceae sp. CCFEE 6253]